MSKENNSKEKLISKSNTISWKILDTMFEDNPTFLVDHHLQSYNDFYDKGLFEIMKQNNPIEIRKNYNAKREDFDYICNFYIGGKEGNKVYYGKPIIFDVNNQHYMYPNEARLRNMTYGITIHYDCDIEIMIYDKEVREFKIEKMTLEKILLGNFPIMVNSKQCIYSSLNRDLKFYMGECRNDIGGYFIIDGKEKVLVPQEKFADNMLYVKKNEKTSLYSYSAIIRTVSEDASKPIRTLKVHIVAPTDDMTNGNILVELPNVRKPIPLFIVMRALGIISDKEIIKYCILDLEKNESYLDLFRPCIHDAGLIFSQELALEYISSFMKNESTFHAMEILMNYFLPNIGELNFKNKAYYLGYMVFSILKVHVGVENPTDRDNFNYKRVELCGTLLYELFNEYYIKQKKNIALTIDKDIYFHHTIEEGVLEIVNLDHEGTINMIKNNYKEYFKQRIVEDGVTKKAFKGNWGASSHTKRLGIIQDLNRLSYNSYISQLRKINLPLDASAKVVGPRLLHNTQWGIIDPIDTPDGGNIGLHKHMSISSIITTGYSMFDMIDWLKKKINLYLLEESYPEYIYQHTKIFINGCWIGFIIEPFNTVNELKLHRRLGLIPKYTSISFNIQKNTIFIYTDSGRICRPIYYVTYDNIPSVFLNDNVDKILSKDKLTWNNLIYGFNKRKLDTINNFKIYNINDLYEADESNLEKIIKNAAVIDYIDTNESESSLIAFDYESFLKKDKNYTHVEIHPSLIFGVMGNQVIYPENNPPTRNLFSCGQSKQATSTYHSNYQNRFDKSGIVLNYGQIPLIKSKYIKYINNEELPYGVNTIVAIMCYTGYNVEDAILINKGSVDRGLFRTTYYNMYESKEESSSVPGSNNDISFTQIDKNNVYRKKDDYDYSKLDENGLVMEGVKMNDKIAVIGKAVYDESDDRKYDSSVFPKKGQLGIVDKVYISSDEEGFRIAKVRIREERLPAIGDKMASRAGQKGTIGLVIPEEDMPFTENGIKPDLIINPHAIPSRMTIGQLTECLFGKMCVEKGVFGDCTAYGRGGAKEDFIGDMLNSYGYHNSGDEIMYNGMTGEQLNSTIFIGPTYYMRLKHMVKDKINYRNTGPITSLTRQSVHGRANDGGLRIGEMERDGVIAHGASMFLRESFMVRGDKYALAICNHSGNIAVYNIDKNQFYSPMVDGKLKYTEPLNEESKIKNITKHGRSFSIVKVPYTFKLLIQELQSMNIQMRVITEDNIDQLMSMSYSNNLNKLTGNDNNIVDYGKNVKTEKRRQMENYEMENYEMEKRKDIDLDKYDTDDSENENENENENIESPPYVPESFDDDDDYKPGVTPPNTNNTPPYANDNSPPYAPISPESVLYDKEGNPVFAQLSSAPSKSDNVEELQEEEYKPVSSKDILSNVNKNTNDNSNVKSISIDTDEGSEKKTDGSKKIINIST